MPMKRFPLAPSRGMTLIEFLIAFVTLFLVFGAIFATCAKFTMADQAQADAQKTALKTVTLIWPEAKDVRAVCQGMDTNGDGYVSCTVIVDGRTEAMDCPGLFSIGNTTCRLSRAVLDSERVRP